MKLPEEFWELWELGIVLLVIVVIYIAFFSEPMPYDPLRGLD